MAKLREVIFEFRRIGAYMKVSAVDPITYTEVHIMGPVNASKDVLEGVALRKLQHVLKKQLGKAPMKAFVV